MKALVTGAAGLIGASLVRDLLERGVNVQGLVRESTQLAALDGLDVELHFADVRNGGAALEDAARGCDLLFHTAMHFTYDRRNDAELATAMDGAECVLRAAAAAGVRRVVVTSSSVVFGYNSTQEIHDESHPLSAIEGENAYVGAKIVQHRGVLELGRALGLDVVLVCPTVSVGPYGTSLGPSNGLIVAYLADPLRATYPGGCNIVSTVDVAAGHWLAAAHGVSGEQYILGAQNLEYSAVHALIANLAGVEQPRMKLGHGFSYLASAVEEVKARCAGRAPLGTREQATMLGRYYWYHHAKAQRLGYQPRPARAALASALSWLAASGHVSREIRATLRLHDDVYATRRQRDGTPRLE